MRKLTIAALVLIAAFTTIKASAQGQYHYTIHQGESLVWKPFLGCANESTKITGQNEAIASVTNQVGDIKIKGLSLGELHLEAQAADGNKETITVKVIKPNDYAKESFSGSYTLTRPKDNYRATMERMTNELEPIYLFSWAKIGKINMHLSSELNGEGDEVIKYDATVRYAYESIDGSKWAFPLDDQTEAREAYYALVESNKERAGEDYMEVMEEFNEEFISKLGQAGMASHYVGKEEVLGIECWVFDARAERSIGSMFWVDPSSGLCLKRMEADGSVSVITQLDKNYTKWDNGFKP